MLDPIVKSMAASEVLSELQESGLVGYVTKEWKTILDTKGLAFPFVVEDGLYGAFESFLPHGQLWEEISNGDICKVVFDGAEYTILAVVTNNEIEIGNIEGTDDGVPFLFHFFDTGAEWQLTINAMGAETEHSFALYLQTETIHPIDKKYLPDMGGGGLPVVELETAINSTENGDGGWTGADADKITAAYELGTPVIFKFTANGTEYTQIFSRAFKDGELYAFQSAMFFGGQAALVMIVRAGDHLWLVMAQKLQGA